MLVKDRVRSIRKLPSTKKTRYVYDLEVNGGTMNELFTGQSFIANGVLVHNSFY